MVSFLTFVGASHPRKVAHLLLLTANKVGEHAHMQLRPVVRRKDLLKVVGCPISHQHDRLVTLGSLTAPVIL